MNNLQKRIMNLERSHRPDIVRASREIESLLKVRECGLESLTSEERSVLSDNFLARLRETYEDYVRNRYKGVETHG